MGYTIFFDESKKIDDCSRYSYYGAIAIEEAEIQVIEKQIDVMLEGLNKTSELHFVNYKGADIQKYFQVLNYFLSCSNLKINIYRLDNEAYFRLGRTLNFSEVDLRQYFYVKIPERLFYGLVRDNDQIDGLTVVMDDSTEYHSLGVFDSIRDQMNAHSLYRGKHYQVSSIEGLDSKESRLLQVLDVILGIVVYLLEEGYHVESHVSRNKRDLIYRLLCYDDNLERFHDMVSIITWAGTLTNIEFSRITSQFLINCQKGEVFEMLDVQQFYNTYQEKLKALASDDRHGRIGLLKAYFQNPYAESNQKLTNTLVELFLGHLCQLEFNDRNKYLRSFAPKKVD